MSQSFRAYEKDSKIGLAIITGGSSGIGKSIIERLRTLGSDLLVFNLSRRNPASFYNHEYLCHIDCDLADCESRNRAFDSLEHQLDQVEFTGKIALINNAGQGLYGPVDSHSSSKHAQLLEINLIALVELTTRLLPRLKTSGGTIVNIASTTAFQPTPFCATYGASKAFVLNWTLALNEELRHSRVNAVAICPGPTQTDFFAAAGLANHSSQSSLFQSADEVAAIVVDSLNRPRPVIICGWKNRLLQFLSRFVPRSVRIRSTAKIIQRFRNTNPQV